MKKFWIQIGVLLVVIMGALYFGFNKSVLEPFIPVNQNLAHQKIKIGETIIDAEIADTVSRRTKGLGGREALGTDSGMLFVFPENKKHQFWMKGMKFPLDFIFIQNGKVVDLLSKVPPPQPNQADSTLPIYQPVVPIDMLLEVNSGFIDSRRIKVGDLIFLVQ